MVLPKSKKLEMIQVTNVIVQLEYFTVKKVCSINLSVSNNSIKTTVDPYL